MLRKATDMMPFLVPHLPGADENIIWQELLGVLVEACTEAWAYPIVHGPLDITLAMRCHSRSSGFSRNPR